MKVKCEYCSTLLDETDESCPNCGALNSAVKRTSDGIPKTISELKQYCKERNYPLEKMRFFIGEDYKGAKAFGIYKDSDGNVVVYKNKADGTRAERYRGHDETYAVNELYQKMMSEIVNQKNYQANKKLAESNEVTRSGSSESGSKFSSIVTIAIILIVIVAVFSLFKKGPKNGYYYYDDGYYYSYNDSWYEYDYDNSVWETATVDSELGKNYDNYFSSTVPESTETDFTTSDYYYESSSSSDDSWDSDWGSDWDSDATDWDSDW